MPFQLFLDESNKPVTDEKGGVTFVDPATGNKTIFNVNELHDSIRKLNGEAATHRRDKETAVQELAALKQTFDGLDPEKARKALETVTSLDAGKLMEIGKVDEIKRQAAAEADQKVINLNKALEAAKAEAQANLAAKDKTIEDLLIGNGFASSTYLREHTVLPPDVALSYFKDHFKVEYEEGKPVVRARDSQGNIIFSPSNAANPATVEEGIQYLMTNHPQRDLMHKAPSGGGSGMKSSNSNSTTGKMTMEAAANLSPSEYAKARQAGTI